MIQYSNPKYVELKMILIVQLSLFHLLKMFLNSNFYSGKINKIIILIWCYTLVLSQTKPKVTILITLEGGDLLIRDNIKLVGLPQLTTMMLNEGTQNYTAEKGNCFKT